MHWIDVSIPLRNGIVGWPGDVPVTVARRMEIEQGAEYNISMLTVSTHSGTHMDAPLHFITGGEGIDALPLDVTIGPARVIEIADPEIVRAGELEKHDIRPGERILLKTVNSARRWPDLPFREGYVYISQGVASHLVERGVRCVGVDYISVGDTRMETSIPTHRTLLAGGVWIIECLYLADVPAGECELICLPLRVEGAEGAPARAIVGLPLDSARR